MRRLFGAMLGRIAGLPLPACWGELLAGAGFRWKGRHGRKGAGIIGWKGVQSGRSITLLVIRSSCSSQIVIAYS